MFLNFVQGRFFLYLGLWTLKSSMFDRKFGFYVKNPPWGRLESCQIRHPGQNMSIFGFQNFIGYLFLSFFVFKSRFSLETDSKHGLSRSRCVGCDPGILANPAGELNMRSKHMIQHVWGQCSYFLASGRQILCICEVNIRLTP